MPPSPIYVPLLPEEAQWAIGQLHPVAELPFSILLDEDFDTDTYVDIFDGGPTVQERLAMLKSVSRSRLLRVDRRQGPGTTAPSRAHLIINSKRQQFRALLLDLAPDGEGLSLDATTLELLAMAPGDRARVAEFEPAAAGDRA